MRTHHFRKPTKPFREKRPSSFLEILYEDNHIIAINKKPSDIVQGDKTGDIPLSENVANFIAKRDNKPGTAFIGVTHRLDRPVSGVVLFAKTSKALERLNEMFRENEIKKTYWAVVKERPKEDSGTLIHYLIKNEERNKTFTYDEEREGTLRAELDYKLIGSTDTYHLLEINLKTGRHHQIRAQLAKIGCPIKGDLKYGFPRSNPDASISLLARKIEFIHPVKLEPISITANPPRDPVWNAIMSLFPR